MTSDQKTLPRAINPIGAAFLSLNGMIGAGIFVLPAAIAAAAGYFSPWLFLLAGAVFLTVVLSFAELGSYFKDSGGPVLYATAAFGPVAGFNAGWLLYLGRVTAFAANLNVIVTYLGTLAPAFGAGPGRIAFIVAVCLFLTGVNYIGVKDGMRTVGALTVLKLTPLVGLIILGMPHVDAGALFSAALPDINGMGETTLLLFYAYFGFEAALVTAGDTKNPKRTLPRALTITIVGTAIFYFLVELAYIAVLPDGGAAKATLSDVGRQLLGPVGGVIISLTAIFSIGGNLASIFLTSPRLTFSLAEKNLLPPWFSRVHDRFLTPHNSILLFGLIAVTLATTGSFVYLAAASSIARLLVYILSIAAIPVIRRKADPELHEQAFRLPGGLLIPALAIALCAWVASKASAQAWILLGFLLGAGLLLMALEQLRVRRNRTP